MTTRALPFSWLVGLFGMLGLSLPAAADPLDLFGLDALSDHLACKAWCEAGPVARLPSCLALCPVPQADWEKDAVAPLTAVDLQLGVLEHWDEGTLAYICYQNGAVKPKPLCDCTSLHTPPECADQDGDGIPLWLERKLGTSDTVPQAACTANATCGGFQSECRYQLELGRGVCLDRPCKSTNS